MSRKKQHKLENKKLIVVLDWEINKKNSIGLNHR